MHRLFLGLGILLLGLLVWQAVMPPSDAPMKDEQGETGAGTLLIDERNGAGGTHASLRGTDHAAAHESEGAADADASRSGATLKGTVRSAATGKPVAGARVLLSWKTRGDQHEPGPFWAVSDDAGRYELRGIPGGSWIAVPFHAEHGTALTPDLLALARSNRYDFWAKAREAGLVVDVAYGDEGAHELDLTLVAGPRITGTVVDGTGMPLAGATVRSQWQFSGVRLRRQADGPLRHLERTDLAQADQLGRFHMHCFPSGTRRLRLGAAKEGYFGVWKRLDVSEGMPPIQLAAALGATLRGRVHWVGGRPCAAARIYVDNVVPPLDKVHWFGEPWGTTANADGSYAVRVPPDPNHEIRVQVKTAKGAFAGTSLRVGPLPPDSMRYGVDLELATAFEDWICGTLRDASGRPLAGETLAFVKAGTDSALTEDSWNRVETNDEGHFASLEFEGSFDIWLRSAGRSERLAQSIAVGNNQVELVARATRGRKVVIEAVDEQDNPILKFKVRAWSPDGAAEGRFASDGKGRAASRILGDGKLLLDIQPTPHPGNVRKTMPGRTVEWAPDETGVMRVVMGPHPEFLVRLLDQHGQPIADAELRWRGHRRLSDAEGFWRIRLEDPDIASIDDYEITPPRGHRIVTMYGSVEPGTPEIMRTTSQGWELRGRFLVDGKVDPAFTGPLIHVGWEPETDDEWDQLPSTAGVVDPAGRITASALPTGRAVVVQIDPMYLRKLNLVPTQAPIQVHPDQPEVEIHASRGLVIRGRLEGPGLKGLQPKGLSLQAVKPGVQASHLTLGQWAFAERIDPVSGTFTIRGLSPGSYTLRLATPRRGAVARLAGVAAGTDGVVLHVPRQDGRLDVQVRGIDASEVAEAQLLVFQEGHPERSIANGRYRGDLRFDVDRLAHGERYSVLVRVWRKGSDRWGPPSHVAAADSLALGSTTHLELQRPETLQIDFRGPGVAHISQIVFVHTAMGVCEQTWALEDEPHRHTQAGLIAGTYRVLVDVMTQTSQRQIVVENVETNSDPVVVEIK